MIRVRQGDMFDVDADWYVDAANCVGAQGAGVSKEFKARYPSYAARYRQTCDVRALKPGTAVTFHPRIITAATKYHWRDPSRYEWIEGCARDLKRFKGRISLPALGCGHGGLEWDIVQEILIRHLETADGEFVVSR